MDTESMLVVVPFVTQAGNAKEQIQPTVPRLQALPEEVGCPEKMLADTGYFSLQNVMTCHEAGIEPMLAVGREGHHPHWLERLEEPLPLADNATPLEAMKHRLKTQKGGKRSTPYALRQQTVEPVFGIVKSVMGFRQFLLRGLENVQNE